MIGGMVDFGHLKTKLKEVVEFTFYDLVGEPTVLVRSSGEKNKAYYNEKLRRLENVRKRRTKISVDMLVSMRELDRDLFPKFVITGFGENVVDRAGAKVPFSLENVKAFVAALGDTDFDELRDFTNDESSFGEPLDKEAAAGNSQPG